MELKYFSLHDDKDTLKKKWKKLALKYHPDKNTGDELVATKIMQDINNELEYCIKFGGSFDISKFDFKNPRDLRDVAKMFVTEMMDDLIKDEKSNSVREFYMRAKNIIENGIKRAPLIQVVRDTK